MSIQLVLLFLFLITASATDIKTGKVRNKDILIYLLLGLVYYAVILAKGFAAHDASTLQILKYAGINLVLSFIVSFIVRSAGIWPAGDAKTFLVASFLIPLVYYKHVYFLYFPGFTLLINIFIMGVVYIGFKSAGTFFTVTVPLISLDNILRLPGKGLDRLLSEWGAYLKIISSYLIVYFTMNFITQIVSAKSGFIVKIAPEFFFVLLFFFMRTVGGFVNKFMKAINHVEMYGLFILLAFYMNGWSLDKTGAMLMTMSGQAILFMLAFGAIQAVADYYINKAQTQTIDLSDLKAGDLPARSFLETLSPGLKAHLKVPPEGLSAENLEQILNDAPIKTGGAQKATVYLPTPFVPIIFAGVLFTVVTGISSVQYLKLLIFR